MRSRLFIAVWAVCILTGCSLVSSKRPNVYGSLVVRYIDSEQRLQAYANYYEGDTLATAHPKAWPGGVSMLGSAMESRTLPNGEVRYSAERRMDFVEDVTFRFADESKKQREIRVALKRVDNLALNAPASISSGLTLTYKGLPLAAGETLVLIFTDVQGYTYTSEVAGPLRSNEVLLPARDIAAMIPGRYQVYAVRKRSSEEKDGRFTHHLEVEFYSRTAEVEITP